MRKEKFFALLLCAVVLFSALGAAFAAGSWEPKLVGFADGVIVAKTVFLDQTKAMFHGAKEEKTERLLSGTFLLVFLIVVLLFMTWSLVRRHAFLLVLAFRQYMEKWRQAREDAPGFEEWVRSNIEGARVCAEKYHFFVAEIEKTGFSAADRQKQFSRAERLLDRAYDRLKFEGGGRVRLAVNAGYLIWLVVRANEKIVALLDEILLKGSIFSDIKRLTVRLEAAKSDLASWERNREALREKYPDKRVRESIENVLKRISFSLDQTTNLRAIAVRLNSEGVMGGSVLRRTEELVDAFREDMEGAEKVLTLLNKLKQHLTPSVAGKSTRD